MTPRRSRSASVCEQYRELIDLGLSRGRHATAIWQALVDGHGFTVGYQSVQRFVGKLRRAAEPEARAVIQTAPGEDYGEFRVMVRAASPLRVLIARGPILRPPSFP